MSRPIKDLTNQKFGKLTPLYPTQEKKGTNIVWHCLCDCGNEINVVGCSLTRGQTKSCGCLRSEVGLNNIKKAIDAAKIKNRKYENKNETTTRLYKIWSGMKTRCDNPNHINYSCYGGKGITYCLSWTTFDNFKEWALSNGYEENLTIDRINANNGYCPENCRWVDMKQQQNNRSNNHLLTFNGKTQTMKQWAEELGINYGTLKGRIRKGWSIEQALTRGVRKGDGE